MKIIKPFAKNQEPTATLFILATPIGNLSDVSKRLISTLEEVDFIACEDKRVTRKLLSALDIKHKNLISYHNYNEIQTSQQIIEILQNGQNVALVSDAGMPTISDPGYRLINLVKEHNFNLSVIPGPSALINAMAASGFYHKFLFFGFLHPKTGKRQTELTSLMNLSFSLIFYCSPYKLKRTLEDINVVFTTQPNVMVAKELTKMHETFYFGTAREILDGLPETIKGEYVIIIDNYSK